MNKINIAPEITGKRILFGVLDWGLGHASESISLIRLLSQNNEVHLLAGGAAALFLKCEFPELPLIEMSNYHIRYAKHHCLLVPRLIFQLPEILFSLWQEHKETESLVKNKAFDLIFSDNRYGIYSKMVPSYFITHQLRVKLPERLNNLEIISEWFHRWYFRKYTGVLVLDNSGPLNLAGDLTHAGKIIHHPKIHYIGFWSSLKNIEIEKDIDALAIISGPEPHRRIFADKVIGQMKSITGKRVVILGEPERAGNDYVIDGIEIYCFVNRRQVNHFLNRAKLVICRPGYASVMDMITLNKTALMVPTPGQTEQEYQADYWQRKKYFYTVQQKKMNLQENIPAALEFSKTNYSDFLINQANMFWGVFNNQKENR